MSTKTATPEPITTDEIVEPTLVDVSEPTLAPGDPGYDWSQHYGDADLYLHTFGNGKTVALKVFGSIYNKTWLFKIRKAQSNSEIEFASIERAACDEAIEVLEGLPDDDGDPISDLWNAWIKAGTANDPDGDDGLTAPN